MSIHIPTIQSLPIFDKTRTRKKTKRRTRINGQSSGKFLYRVIPQPAKQMNALVFGAE
jgi:hypothetical protein